MALDRVKVSLERKFKIFLIEILCGILLQFNYLDVKSHHGKVLLLWIFFNAKKQFFYSTCIV